MEIKYETVICKDDMTYLLYKNIYLKGDKKSTHLIFETKDSSEHERIKTELEGKI